MISTNRDFYLRMRALGQAHAAAERPLELYLRALLGLVAAHRAAAGLEAEAFAGLLEEAFRTAPPPFDAAEPAEEGAGAGWREVDGLLRGQIVDLRELAARGQLDDPQRSFGLNAPRGARWYNFDPAAYLECGAQGAFDGWDEDDGGRLLVPGRVAVLTANGSIAAVDPRELTGRRAPLAFLRWEHIGNFLSAGRDYE